MDKNEVVQLGIKELEMRLDNLEKTIEGEDKKRKEAPSAMESWSDNTRFEKEMLIGKLEEEKSKIKRHIAFLQNLSSTPKTKVEEGALIEVKNPETSRIQFYFVSIFAGLEIKIDDDREVLFISKNSPLLNFLLNKEEGNEFKVEIDTTAQKLKILSIK